MVKTKTFLISNGFQLTSRWTTNHVPSTAERKIDVDISELPEGCLITKASLSVNTNGSGESNAIYNDIKAYVTNNHTTGSDRGPVDVTAWFPDVPKSITITFTFKAYGGGTGSSKTCWFGAGNIPLELIIEYEMPASTGTSVYDGDTQTVTLTISANSDEYSHYVTWKIGGWTSDPTGPYGPTENAEQYTATFNAGAHIHDILADLSDSDTAKGIAVISTYLQKDGASEPILIGTYDSEFDYVLPDVYAPVVTVGSVSPYGSPEHFENYYLQSKTRAEIENIQVIWAEGSTAKTVKCITGNTETEAVYDDGVYECITDVITGSGSVNIYVVATDSRGRSTVYTVPVTVWDYYAPVISAITANRCDDNHVLDDYGGNALVTVTYDVPPIYATAGVNVTTKLYYKKRSEAAYTDPSVSFVNNTPAFLEHIASDNVYVIKAEITDPFGKAVTAVVNVSTAMYIMHFNKNGSSVAIGQAATELKTFAINPQWNVLAGGTNIAAYPRHLSYMPDTVSDADSLTDVSDIGTYTAGSGTANIPASASNGGKLIVFAATGNERTAASGDICQLLVEKGSGDIYIRTYDGVSAFGNWQKLMKGGEVIDVSHGGTGVTSVAAAKTAFGFVEQAVISADSTGTTTSMSNLFDLTLDLADGDTWEGCAVLKAGTATNTDFAFYLDGDTTDANYKQYIRYGTNVNSSENIVGFADNTTDPTIIRFSVSKLGGMVIIEGQSMRSESGHRMQDFVIVRECTGGTMQIVPKQASAGASHVVMKKVF